MLENHHMSYFNALNPRAPSMQLIPTFGRGGLESINNGSCTCFWVFWIPPLQGIMHVAEVASMWFG